MWTDKETHLDLIGFRVHADLIRSVVTDPTLLPVTIGLFADWGGGKTSLMRMLEHDLDPDNCGDDAGRQSELSGVACLYFNGWLFEGYDDAKSAILSSVLVALVEHKRFGPKVREKAESLLKSVNWMRVASLGMKHVAFPAIAAYATGGTSLLPTLAQSMGSLVGCPTADSPVPTDQANSGQGDHGVGDDGADDVSVDSEELIRKNPSPTGPMDVRSFREQFAKMLAESDIDRLIVLIDDLDRCSPERIIENLEAIKLFLNVDSTAFVIGADPRIVRHAIAWKYRDYERVAESEESEGDSGDRLITDYLEKLIQFPYHLPRLSPAEIETYMVLLFCERHLENEPFQSVVAACNQQRTENRYTVFGSASVKAAMAKTTAGEPDNELAEALTFCAAVAPLVTEGLKGNPRQVKRFLNAFVMRKKLAHVANLDNIDDAVLVKLMLLEYVKERWFRQLYNWQAAQKGHPKKIAELEKAIRPPDGNVDDEATANKIAEQWGGSWLRRWLAIDPPLGGIDLRDYFWVARDRLQSTLTGLSMVPPIVRRAFDGLMSGKPGKQKASIETIRELPEDDNETLFGLIEQRISQQLNDKGGFDALRKLVEADIGGAARLLAEVLSKYPYKEMPAAV